MNKLIPLLYLSLTVFLTPIAQAAEEEERAWQTSLKEQYFPGQAILESTDVIELDAPYRAEDPALVPVKITGKQAQTASSYIKKLWVLVDNNPLPFVGEFEFTPDSGKADMAMRIRVNTYSYIRAIAQMNDGRLYMAKKFVKASGGCSAPVGANLEESLKRLGKMKFRLDQAVRPNQPNLVQLLISHPNLTGMQMDQMSRHVKPANFIKNIKVSFDGKPVFSAKTDIAISSDPNFRFYFAPQKAGALTAEFTETSCASPIARDECTEGKTFTESYQVQP